MRKLLATILLCATFLSVLSGCGKDGNNIAETEYIQTTGQDTFDTAAEYTQEDTVTAALDETEQLDIASMNSDEKLSFIKEQLGNPGVTVSLWDGGLDDMGNAIKILDLKIPDNIYGKLSYRTKAQSSSSLDREMLQVSDCEDKYTSSGDLYVKMEESEIDPELPYDWYYGQNFFGEDYTRDGEVQFSVEVDPMTESDGWFISYSPLEGDDGIVGYDYGTNSLSVYYFVNGCDVYVTVTTYNENLITDENAYKLAEYMRSFVDMADETRHVEADIPDFS